MSDWALTLSLVSPVIVASVSACSNAITLEQLTSTHPNSGPLITFFQFLVVSLYGLPRHLIWTPSSGPRLKPRTVPLSLYLVQVGLFYFISLLNSAAFAYGIPMSVHIIFRSGGLLVSMLMGLVVGKKYTWVQVVSVLLVTAGVALTTLSASPASSTSFSFSRLQINDTNAFAYAKGIAILAQALLLSGLLGLVQDWTYSVYGRPSLTSDTTANGTTASSPAPSKKPSSTWQESMFYLHFLSLPMFFFFRGDILSQLRTIHSPSSSKFFLPAFPLPSTQKTSIHIPTVYIPLLVNTLTQLVCVAGVNRLTTRMSALTVTLVLVVRKAVSLVLSVVCDGIVVKYAAKAMGDPHFGTKKMDVDARMMWSGAALVMLGTIGYSLGGTKKYAQKEKNN
ncbi:hypothetical protein AX15_003847 [Amanita polypyramis BW_CC]|nr:hypothetical protein AX15_003847 [Amanita polypyramis BW_CC]